MIDSSEHVYDDDPARGHPDVRTRLRDVSYFFVGNGLVQAAVQWAPAGEGTPLGLLVMDPERLRKKREALTLDPERGLQPTVVRVCHGGTEESPRIDRSKADAWDARPTVEWTTHQGVPAVQATWGWSGGRVTERFFCPDSTTARLVREVTLDGDAAGRVVLRTGLPGHDREIWPRADSRIVALVYELDPAAQAIELRAETGPVKVDPGAAASWANRSSARFGHEILDRLWRASTCQLSAVPARSGRFDASVWQYNREWVRDQALVALGLVAAGNRGVGARILQRLLREFVTAEGGTVDSSEVRHGDEAELDQNGVLLYALHRYVLWTGDMSVVTDGWPRVAAVADYPLRPEFAHPCGLLHNRREFWERHRIHGIEPGFELAHQVFVSLGLTSAAALARRVGRAGEAARWEAAASRLKAAVLEDGRYRLVSDGALVKRRRLDGEVQRCIEALPEAALPPGVPLGGAGPHWLEPDTCTVLPIVFGFVDPGSELAARTLDEVEPLWNQAWNGGGYGRYHVSSEPDSPGAWPFASLFVARASLEAGRDEPAWRVLEWLDRAPGSPAGSWFEFYGPRVAPPFPQVGIIPWTWSEIVMLLVGQVLGVRPAEGGVRIHPRLLPGIESVSARIPLAGHELEIDVVRGAKGRRPVVSVRVDGGRRRAIDGSPLAI